MIGPDHLAPGLIADAVPVVEPDLALRIRIPAAGAPQQGFPGIHV